MKPAWEMTTAELDFELKRAIKAMRTADPQHFRRIKRIMPRKRTRKD